MYKQLIPDTEFETWMDLNADELDNIFDQTGLSNQLDFDWEKEAEKIFMKDIRNFYENY